MNYFKIPRILKEINHSEKTLWSLYLAAASTLQGGNTPSVSSFTFGAECTARKPNTLLGESGRGYEDSVYTFVNKEIISNFRS